MCLLHLLLEYETNIHLHLHEFQEEATQMSDSRLRTFQGQAYPLGVSEVDNGINFSIFSQHATAVILCLSLPDR